MGRRILVADIGNGSDKVLFQEILGPDDAVLHEAANVFKQDGYVFVVKHCEKVVVLWLQLKRKFSPKVGGRAGVPHP